MLDAPEAVTLGDLPNLNARRIGFYAGPGAGKTKSAREFVLTSAPVAVCAIDPAGQLSKELAGDDVHVLPIPRDWEQRPALVPKVLSLLRERKRVCCAWRGTYLKVGEFVRALMAAAQEAALVDIVWVFDEAQQVLGQGREEVLEALGAVEMGRNWNWGIVMLTQRPAELTTKARGRCDTIFFSRLTEEVDRNAIDGRLSAFVSDKRQREDIIRLAQRLPAGQFVKLEQANLPTVNQ